MLFRSFSRRVGAVEEERVDGNHCLGNYLCFLGIAVKILRGLGLGLSAKREDTCI